MNIQARVQGVSNVLDQNYAPTTPEEVELFDEMQKFMYAILDKNVLTDQGRAIVRAHEATYDAQKAYNEIKNHHNSSTKAKIEASSILSYITSVKIDDDSWQGTAEGFILNWQEQLAKYENITDTAETFSDIQKYNMLQNAVMPITDLHNVKVNVDIWYIITGNILSYQQYVGLLLSAASLHDTKFGAEQHQHMDMYTIKEDRDNKASDISSIDNTHHITQPIPWVEAKTHILYQVSQARSCFKASLIDRGANGGVAGSDVRIIHQTPPNARRVDIQGIDDHQLTNIPIGTVGGVVTTQHGPVIAIMHQYALHGKGQTIHSPGQFEWYKIVIDDKSIHVGGLQRIKTLDGYIIPLTIKNGLARLEIRPYTDHEWDTLPHVILTSEDNWDPSVLDFEHDEDDWYDAVKELEGNPHANLFDEFGNYRHRMLEDNTQQVIDHDIQNIMEANEYEHEPEDDVKTYSQPRPPRITNNKIPNFKDLRPYFGWISEDIIENTFLNTTQLARLPTGTNLQRAYKTPNPALNVSRHNEPVACDIFYADDPAIADGSTTAVIYVGCDTLVTDIQGIKTDSQFVNTLEDNIRKRGAPNMLISDRAQVEISKKVQDILRSLVIKQWQSEPYQQNQNPAERRYQTVKRGANRVMDRSGAPPSTWLLALKYVVYILNHAWNDSIKSVPLQLLHGSTVDISPILRFYFWQKVYYARYEDKFPSTTKEGTGRFVGFSEHVGHAMCYKILTDETQVIIHRSVVRPYDPQDPNIRADMLGGEEEGSSKNPIIKSKSDHTKDLEQSKPLDFEEISNITTFNPTEIIGRTFLMDQQQDGQRHRARIVKLVEDHENNLQENPERIKYICSVNNDTAEEIITYNQLMDYLSKEDNIGTDRVWKFRRITTHEGPLSQSHPNYKGSKYNVMIEWENGEITSEPLSMIAADDPVTCAIYAKEKNLLNKPAWKRFKGIAKRQKKFTRMVNHAKLRSFNTAPRFKYGYEVPRTYNQAIAMDERNNNTLWQDAVKLELQQINQYQTFQDQGHQSIAKLPDGHKRIRVHFVFDVKHDGRHKARLVADGHLTDVPLDSVYSGVVSLRGFRLVLFLAELNGLETWATDIGNAYLEAKTNEKVYIIGGPEFGDREGHILIIHKALYGLRSSGARWHDKFSDVLHELGFKTCKAEPDIWLRCNGDIYEYIATYVDDLALVLKDPKTFTKVLEEKYGFKLKGTGRISFHLGMDFFRDEHGVLCIKPERYINKMIDNYKRIFGESPTTKVSSPLEKNDHPELDDSEFLDEDGILLYQSLVGALQWTISIGRFDIQTAVMSLSSFRAAPR